MRIVDEVPGQHGNERYPWNDIRAAVEAGNVVAMDPEEYNISLTSLSSAVRAYRDRREPSWKVMQREGVLYIGRK